MGRPSRAGRDRSPRLCRRSPARRWRRSQSRRPRIPDRSRCPLSARGALEVGAGSRALARPARWRTRRKVGQPRSSSPPAPHRTSGTARPPGSSPSSSTWLTRLPASCRSGIGGMGGAAAPIDGGPPGIASARRPRQASAAELARSGAAARFFPCRAQPDPGAESLEHALSGAPLGLVRVVVSPCPSRPPSEVVERPGIRSPMSMSSPASCPMMQPRSGTPRAHLVRARYVRLVEQRARHPLRDDAGLRKLPDSGKFARARVRQEVHRLELGACTAILQSQCRRSRLSPCARWPCSYDGDARSLPALLVRLGAGAMSCAASM